jgi:hypothetical protein
MKKLIVAGFLTLCFFTYFGCSTDNNIKFIQKEGQIDVIANNKLLTSYLYGNHLSKPILYPVHSPSGEVVTRWFPLKEVEGEGKDHPHHTGVYFTYGSNHEVNGNSYWANAHDRLPLTMAEKLPRISHIKINELKEGKNKGKMAVLFHWLNKNNKPILEENRVMEFYAGEDEYKIDFTINLTAIDTIVTFGDTKEGMFAIRVADWLAENARGTLYQSTGEYLNSEGDKTEKNIWAKQSPWVRLEGEKEGNRIGIAIFHHPGSLNYPTYWHARGYGCFSANPLGQYDFQEGRGLENPQHRTLTLKPGESALFKFRMVIYEGTRNKEQFDLEFSDFSKN